MEKVWRLNEKQFETKQKKAQVRKQYDDEVRMLQMELHTKVERLQMERDRKLDEISLEYARYEDEYRQWKREHEVEPQKEQ